MDIRESMVSGCAVPAVLSAAAAWFLGERSPTAARILSGVAALGVLLGLYMIVSLRLTARGEKQEQDKKEPPAGS